ncbi:23S rRNA (uracil(1939)-C(5))-methyltransferase RlmD [Azohydromonas sediminis]|uniref:23S rRNA (uracil(1939)-C(5))-methyltransferase RlmD n=1 Tax=Azohydromonas sediminis TaxID=2259674 RepID=UPI000E64D8EA|nr:23S rRNA (uracil(1939)-C(5))-methyltransferase RlmD [Azohydromonas sediminis]
MTAEDEWLRVESLDLDAQGVAHDAQGKVVFIEGALPGECVQVHVMRRKAQWEQAVVAAVRDESAQRVRPACPHFGLHAGACGGCKMQHLHPSAQVAVKQRVLEDQLWHLGKVRPERVLRPIEGPAWGYRYRARLSVRHVPKKGGVLVGFHERKSSYVADMTQCPVLPPAVGALLVPLRALVASMDARDRVPQIELAVGEAPGGTVVALVLRHLEPLSASDLARLRDFARAHGVQWWLQPKGPDSVHRLDEGGAELAYALPEFGLVMPFRPTDFTQVNHAINRVLVHRAVRLLDAQPGERVIDWFCGLGNFTLPLATRAGEVLGVEGSDALVQRARDNAQRNGLAGRARFDVRNLFELDADALLTLGTAERWLVDPPREGAFALAKALVDLQQRAPAGWAPPRRIVYVSCNPATLARDAGLLVHQGGWRCSAAGAVNMFPHTAHVESVAVFDRG